MKKSREIIKKLASITVAFAVAFTMIPFAAGVLDVHATNDVEEEDIRIFGETRYDTAKEVAEKYRSVSGSEKFENVVVAYGQNFPDALSGGYLAKVKNAPILIVHPLLEDDIVDYIEENIADDGIVYILGSTGVVSTAFENKIRAKGIEPVRLGGKDRFETNLKILKAAEVDDEDLLVCSAFGYADSLSASAAGKPILLVDRTLSDSQKEYIQSLSTENIYLIGGTGVVTNKVEREISDLGYEPERLWGPTRFETSTAVAEAFFDEPQTVVLTYAYNFPDGLTGGPLAMLEDAPIILTAPKTPEAAREYIEKSGSVRSITLGGASLVTDKTVKFIMDRDKDEVFTAASLTGPTDITLNGDVYDYTTASSGAVSWSVSDPAIATISSTFTSSKKTTRICSLVFKSAGTVTLTAKSELNGKSKTIDITVTDGSGSTNPDQPAEPEVPRTKIECVNYAGNDCTMWLDENGVYWDSETGGSEIAIPASYDRSIDATWTSNGFTFVQRNGVTVKGVAVNLNGDGIVKVDVYNGDTSFAKLIVREETKKYSNYAGNDFEAIFVLDSDDNRLTMYRENSEHPERLYFNTYNNFGYDGFVGGTVHIDAYYDFNNDGVLSDDEFISTGELVITPKPAIQRAYEIAQAAVEEYDTSSYMADMAAISAYMFEHYDYYEQVDGVSMYKCIGGANALRAWSLKEYGVVGMVYEAEGQYGANGHEVFYPEGGNPYTNRAWFEANGHGSNSSNQPGTDFYNSYLEDLKAQVEEYKSAGI